MTRSRGWRTASRRPSATSASTAGGSSRGGASVSRRPAASSVATAPRPAHTTSTLPTPASEIRIPANNPAVTSPADSSQVTTTLTAVSWSAVAATDGTRADCAGRVVVCATQAITADA